MTLGRKLTVAAMTALAVFLASGPPATADDAAGAQRRQISKAFFKNHSPAQYAITAVRAEGNFGLVAWSTAAGKRARGSGTSYFERESAADKYGGVVERDVPQRVKRKLNAPLVFTVDYGGIANYSQLWDDIDDETGAHSNIDYDAPLQWDSLYRGLKIPLTGAPSSQIFIRAAANPNTIGGAVWDAVCQGCVVEHTRCAGLTETPAGSEGNLHSPAGLNSDVVIKLDIVPAQSWNLTSMTTEAPPDAEGICPQTFDGSSALFGEETAVQEALTEHAEINLGLLRSIKKGQQQELPVTSEGTQPTPNCSASRADECTQFFEADWTGSLAVIRTK